jgi:uncharacterized membrane protein YoaK (UPF0700 family)
MRPPVLPIASASVVEETLGVAALLAACGGFGEALFQGAFNSGGMAAFEKARNFGAICLAFLAGAILGGLCTAALDNRALWIVDVLLVVVWMAVCSAAVFATASDQLIKPAYAAVRRRCRGV